MSPAIKRSSESMLVRPNGDGSYSATWTPSSVGWYSLMITVDSYSMENVSTTLGHYRVLRELPIILYNVPRFPPELQSGGEGTTAGHAAADAEYREEASASAE